MVTISLKPLLCKCLYFEALPARPELDVHLCGSGGCLGSAAEWVERGCGSGNGV